MPTDYHRVCETAYRVADIAEYVRDGATMLPFVDNQEAARMASDIHTILDEWVEDYHGYDYGAWIEARSQFSREELRDMTEERVVSWYKERFSDERPSGIPPRQ